MRRLVFTILILLLTMFSAQPMATPELEFHEKLARFHRHYNQFVRAYLGCAKEAAYIEDCKPNLGTFDMSEFNYARKEAGPLFDLERKKE